MPNYSNKTVGTITTNGGSVTHATRFLAPGVISAQVSNSFTGTIQIEASMDGTTFFAYQMVDSSSTHGNSPSTHTSVTTTHLLVSEAYAIQYVRFRASAWSTGTATITIVSLNG